MSEALFTGAFKDFTKEEIEEIFNGYKKIDVRVDTNVVDLIIEMGIASSKREAREFVSSNAVSINGDKVTDLEYVISDNDFLDDTYIVIKRGKKNYYIGIFK